MNDKLIEPTLLVGRLKSDWFNTVSANGTFSIHVNEYYAATMKNGLVNWCGPEKGKPGKQYFIEISEIETDFSRKQRNYFEALVKEWSKFVNEPSVMIRELLKIDFGVCDFHKHPTKGLIAVPKSTTKYSKKEFADLIQAVESLCLENGINLDEHRSRFDA